MFTFNEFIAEDFNSPKATQFKLTIPGGKSGFPSDIFFETLPYRPFNLIRYSKSFNSEIAFDTMHNIYKSWRCLVFAKNTELLIFVWKVSLTHESIARALTDKISLNKFPDYPYLKVYNNTTALNSDKTIGDQWCFPITFKSDILRTNLSDQQVLALNTQKKIENLFQLTDQQMKDLTKYDL
jgi:hypothetical protein